MKIRDIICLALVLVYPCTADIIYDVDFEDPPHVLDQPVVTGTGSDRPTSASGTVIRDNIADFTSQVAYLEGGGAMSFFSDIPSSAGIVSLSWDLAMVSLGVPGPETAAIGIDGSQGGGITTYFMQDSNIRIGGVDVATFTLGQQDHFNYILDLDSDVYSVSINGGTVVSNQPVGSTFDVQNVVFSRDYLADPRYAVDNFQWSIIPEPSVLLLMMIGGIGFWLRRLRVR